MSHQPMSINQILQPKETTIEKKLISKGNDAVYVFQDNGSNLFFFKSKSSTPSKDLIHIAYAHLISN